MVAVAVMREKMEEVVVGLEGEGGVGGRLQGTKGLLSFNSHAHL